jgi:galactokinase
VRSPGRVNIIGEHTDYLGGLCLPMAIDLSLIIAAGRADRGVRIASALYPDLQPCEVVSGQGGAYARLGMLLSVLSERCSNSTAESMYRDISANIYVGGDLPIGAGLSSSAAFTVGILTALKHLHGWNLTDDNVIAVAVEAEHRCGMPCGWMDPAVVVYGRIGHAVFLDCFNEEHSHVTIDTGGFSFVVIDSGVKRDLADGRYANLRNAMESAAAELAKLDKRIEHLRYLDFTAYMSGRESLPDSAKPYLDHFYLENERVKAMIDAFAHRNIHRAGALLLDAHTSAIENLQSGCPETDWIVEMLCGDAACVGARVTGAGFGGAVIALVETAQARSVCGAIVAEGSARFARRMRWWTVAPWKGVCPWRLESPANVNESL